MSDNESFYRATSGQEGGNRPIQTDDVRDQFERQEVTQPREWEGLRDGVKNIARGSQDLERLINIVLSNRDDKTDAEYLRAEKECIQGLRNALSVQLRAGLEMVSISGDFFDKYFKPSSPGRAGN